MSLSFSEQGWNVAAWTMVYFLIGGTALALLGAGLRLAVRNAPPTVRYALSLGLFALLAAMPIGIAAWLADSLPQESAIPVNVLPSPMLPAQAMNLQAQMPEPWIAESAGVIELKDSATDPGEWVADVAPMQTMPQVQPPLVTQAVVPQVEENSQQDAATMWGNVIDYLPWVWLAGSPFTFLLLSAGLVGTGRLRKRCETITTGPIFETSMKLQKALGVGRQVGVAVCDSLVTPVLVGIVRPLILLPPAALTGWSSSELEMVLVHELAHVRRWDNLVNLLQRIVESLLFFHPCVWWVSRWVRRDREECCDAVVVLLTAKPQAYAELLVALASHTTPYGMATSVAMARHPLAGRIRRILKLEEEPMLVTRKTIWLVACGALSIVLSTPLLLTSGAKEPANSELADPANNRSGDETFGSENSETESKSQPTNPEDILVARVYALDISPEDKEVEKYVQAMQGLDEFQVITSVDGKRQLVVSAKNSAHEKLSHFLASKRQHNTDSPFPTLEEQMAADTAYRILGFELEKLTNEELERVKKLGYQGGLRVSFVYDGTGGFVGRGATRRRTDGRFSDGDILVGLHVWPTATLEQVNEILTRDDLLQLIPLKYYKIVQEHESGEQSVQQEEQGGGRGGYGRGYGGEYGGRGEYGGGYGGRSEGEFGDIGEGFGGEMGMAADGTNSQVQMIDKLVTGRFTPNMDAWQAERLRRNGPVPSPLIEASDNPFGAAASQTETAAPENEAKPTLAAKKLVYDGKTFGAWRTSWRTDLSIHSRIEAVHAFVAFANAGVGTEAVGEIFLLATQYPWDSIGGNGLITPLQNACVEVFVEEQVSDELTIEALTKWAHVKEENFQKFLPYILPVIAGRNEATNEALRKALPKSNIDTFEEIRRKQTQMHGGFGGGGFGGIGAIVDGIVEADSNGKNFKMPTNDSEEATPFQNAQLYNGKTFEGWKRAWRRDISPEFREQAVNAFFTFANAGKGKQALDEIVAISLEYPWNPMGYGSQGELQKHLLDVLDDRRLPFDTVLAALVEAKESAKSDHLHDFLGMAGYYLSDNGKQENERLRSNFPDLSLQSYEELTLWKDLSDRNYVSQFKTRVADNSTAWDRPANGAVGSVDPELRFQGKTFDQWKSAWPEYDPRLNWVELMQATEALTGFAQQGWGVDAINEILAIAANFDWNSAADSSGLDRTCITAFRILPLEDALQAILADKDSNNPFLSFAVVTLAQRSAEANALLRKEFPNIQIPEYREPPQETGGLLGGGFTVSAADSVLYDGKSFQLWKQAWRRDISSKSRLDAVNAFVTYANSGKGKEAVDEILEIAGSYRWDFWAGESSGDSVKNACATVFVNKQIPTDLTLTELAAAKNSPNEMIRSFAQFVVGKMANKSRKNNEALRKEFPDWAITTHEQLAVTAALDQQPDEQARLDGIRQSMTSDSDLWKRNDADEITYGGKSYKEWIKSGESTSPTNRGKAIGGLAAFAYRGLEDEAIHEMLALCAELGWSESYATALGNSFPTQFCMELLLVLPLDQTLKAVITAKDSGNPFLPYAVVTVARRSPEANKFLRKEFPKIEIPPYKQSPESQDAEANVGEAISNSENAESAQTAGDDGLAVRIFPFNQRPLSGSRATYLVFLSNNSNSICHNVLLNLRFPEEIVPDVNSLKSPVASSLVGRDLQFKPVASLRPGERLTFTVTSSITGKGKAVITAEARSKETPDGVQTSEEVEISDY